MTRATLLALAARVEAAGGVDDMLNAEIAVATTPGMIDDGGYVGFTGRGDMRPPPDYTASLDAAASLVPAGWWVQHLGQIVDGWRCRVETQGASIPRTTSPLRAATGALALTAAALRARAEEARDGS